MNMIIFLVILVGIILLQIKLSKAENKWLGIILPSITLCFSILTVLDLTTFTTSYMTGTQTITENGGIIKEIITSTYEEPIASFSSRVFSAIYVFVVYNIPTAILLVIYAGYRVKKKKNLELEKKNIQDLE